MVVPSMVSGDGCSMCGLAMVVTSIWCLVMVVPFIVSGDGCSIYGVW